MRRRLALVLVLAFAAGASPGEPPQRAAKGRIQRSPEFVQRVAAAVDRGVAWLRKVQAKDGSFADFPTFPGATTALAYHTLRVSGVTADVPSATNAWEALRRVYRKDELKTYSAALYLMALAEHGQPIPEASDDRDVRLSVEDARWATEIANRLVLAQDANGRWTYTLDIVSALAPDRGGKYDHSNTQYALLGLKCAARCGVGIDRTVWTSALAGLMAAQEPSGLVVDRRTSGSDGAKKNTGRSDRSRGWGYVGAAAAGSSGAATPAMTAGGVSSVIICRSELVGTPAMTRLLEQESERSARDGLAWLGSNWARRIFARVTEAADDPAAKDRTGPPVDLYEAYGLERAGVLADVEWMGELDWFGTGVDLLLDAQQKDGSWAGVPNGLVVADKAAAAAAWRVADTCFALLFLRKGTAPVHRGAITGSADDAGINFVEAAKLEGRDLEDFLDLVLTRWSRNSDEDVRYRLLDGATTAGPRILPPLIARLDAADAEDRTAAHALLQRSTGLDFGYKPAAAADARKDAALQWSVWLFGAKDRLVYDLATRRIVAR